MPYSPTSVPKMSTVSPNGTIAKAETAVMIEIAGARTNSSSVDVCGREFCLTANLTISASGWSTPNGPTRFGP